MLWMTGETRLATGDNPATGGARGTPACGRCGQRGEDAKPA